MIEIDGKQLDHARAALAGIDNGFSRAVRSSLNRGTMGFVTDLVRGTTGRYHVKASVVRRAITRKYANLTDLNALINVKGRRRSIAEYKLRPSSSKGVGQGRLRGAVKTDGLKSLGQAFFVNDRPFFREPEGLVPIVSPAIPQIVKNKESVKEASTGASARFAKRLDHEIARLMRGLKR